MYSYTMFLTLTLTHVLHITNNVMYSYTMCRDSRARSFCYTTDAHDIQAVNNALTTTRDYQRLTSMLMT